MDRKLNARLKKLAEKWGEDIAVRFGDIEEGQRKHEVISTGCLALDKAVGIGGYPRGAISTLMGPPDGGKSTLVLWFLACLHRDGGQGVYINTEHKKNLSYIDGIFEAVGSSPADLVVMKDLESGIAALEAVEALVGAVDAIVLDSIAMLVPGAELDSDLDSKQPGMQARMITKALRRIVPKLDLSRTVWLCTNQLRSNIGGWGPSEICPGGRALAHEEMIRVRISRTGKPIVEKGKKVGITCKAVVHKNQAAAPWGEAEFNIIWGKGLDVVKDTIEMAKLCGVIPVKGGNYYYDWGDKESIKGPEAAQRRLREDPELLARVRADVMSAQISGGEELGDESD